ASDYAECKDVGSILILQGRADEKRPYTKTIATQMWLLGYEFPNTLMFFTKEKIYILASQKKAKILQPLQSESDGVPIEILVHGKDGDKNKEIFNQLISAIKDSGSAVGVITGDATDGKLVDEWTAAYAPEKKDIAERNISRIISNVLAVKEDSEIKSERTAAEMCNAAMQDYFIDEMAKTFDEGKSISNEKIAEKVANALSNDKLSKRLFSKVPLLEMAEWAAHPSVQSGGKYDLSPNAESSSTPLHAGTVVCTLSMRYFMYSATISRTFMIDPTPEQEGNYGFLLDLHKKMLGWMQPGVTMGDVYAKAVESVRELRADLESHFAKSCGWVTGIEMNDGINELKAGNAETLKANMVVVLRLGLENMTNQKAGDKQSKNYSYQL
ncbi:FACT complex subunit spt16, partial [Coemansia sp. IMI 209127]